MNDLTVQESEQIFTKIISGEMSDEEITNFLLALKEKGETAEEILGAVQVMRANMKVVDNLPQDVLDTCGTGGDGLDTLNISTAAALVVAGTYKITVMKHGNRAISSKSGSADVLKELAVRVEGKINPALITDKGMLFLYAPNFHPVIKRIAEIRAKLKTKTIFNLLGPLLNPARAKYQLIGVYDPKYLRIFAEVLRSLGSEKAWIVHGEGGLDEISISGETQVAELDNGAIDIFPITPEDAGLTRHPIESIKGGDAKYNAQGIRDLLDGKGNPAYRDIVLLNSAAALLVAGKARNLVEGVELARESIEKGKAKQVLESLRKL